MLKALSSSVCIVLLLVATSGAQDLLSGPESVA